MELRETGEPGNYASRITDHASLAIFVAAVAVSVMAAALCAAGRYREAAGVTAATIALGVLFSARASIESILIIWFAASPLVSFYVQFPREQAIITFDRVVFALVLIMFGFQLLSRLEDTATRERGNEFSLRLSHFEMIWALLSVLALLSVTTKSEDTGYGTRVAIDSFWLPLVAFYFARHRFRMRGREGFIFAAAVCLGLFLFVTGAYEFRTGTDLFAYKGSQIVRGGEIRVNGPFLSDSSYAGISLLVSLFLIPARRILRVRLDTTARIAYFCAVASAIIASLLPLFRAVWITLALSGLIIFWGLRKSKKDFDSVSASPRLRVSASLLRIRTSRARIVALVLVLLSAAVIGVMFNGEALGKRLSSPESVYSRLATWKAAIGIAIERPLFGVGLTNYSDYFQEKYWGHDRSGESVFDEQAAAFPHSNLLWIVTEMGVFAFALYIAANVYIFLMGYRAYKKAGNVRQRAAAICYLALVVAYWIPGLTLTSGIYSDLNLYFFFLLGLLLNISRTEEGDLRERREARQVAS